MPGFRYPQFCPVARAAEIVGERWTLLIVRELLVGPQRFVDLRAGLSEVSPSVLASRLARLEERGVVTRRELPPPASASVYELTPLGRGLLPVLLEVGRWGLQLMEPPRPDERFDPGWLRLGLMMIARRGPVPRRRYAIEVPDGERTLALGVVGGAQGAEITAPLSEPDLSLRAPPLVVLGVATGGMEPEAAVRSGALRATGDLDALVDFPALFEMPTPTPA